MTEKNFNEQGNFNSQGGFNSQAKAKKKVYVGKAPSGYVDNVSVMPNGQTAYYYMVKNKPFKLDGDELHLVINQSWPRGKTATFTPDLEGKITNQYMSTVGKLFNTCNSNESIGLPNSSTLQGFIDFIARNINSSVNANTDIFVVEIELKAPSMHNYTFNANGQLNQSPIIAYI